jgi:glycosyltransferase involved in cell wall biosynthesis
VTGALGKVGLITPRYAPAVGGVERIVEKLALGLVERGIPVEVVTTDPTGKLPRYEERSGVIVRRFPTLGNDGVYFVSPGLTLWLLRNAARFTLLHAHSYHTPLALQAAIASRRSNVPLVVTTCYHGSGHSTLSRYMHPPYRPIGGWMLRQARRLICISEAERRLLEEHFGLGLPVVVVRSAVETAQLLAARPPQKQRGRRVVLAVGRLESYKQTDRLIAALPDLPVDFDAVIVGEGPAYPRIQELAARVRMLDRIGLYACLPEHELLSWYSGADVFVSLSRHESFGLTVLEAAVAGCPVVASDISAHREVASLAGAGRISLISPECSPSELAASVAAAANLGRTSDVRGWPLPSWESFVEGTLACYRAALADWTSVSRQAA